MTIIKLGKSTYRAYNSAAGVSYLFFLKNDKPILKRIDAPAEFFKRGDAYVETMQRLAFATMTDYITNTIAIWYDQGYLMGSMA